MTADWRVICSRVAVATLFLTAAGPLCSSDAASFLDDRVVIKFRRDAVVSVALPEHSLPEGLADLDRWCADHGIHDGFRLVREHGIPIGDPRLFAEIGLDRIYVIRFPESGAPAVADVVRQLAAEPWVEYAEPAFLFEPLSTVPNDPLFSQQWAHENTGQTGGTPDADMDSTDGWDFGTGDSSSVVAVIDSGVDVDHPDLVANLLPGFDLTNSANGIQDDFGHGTQVAGNAAARGNNGEGVTGICWNCSILPIKILGDAGFVSIEEIADAVRLAADNGADAINMSFGSVGWSLAFIDAVDYAVGLGVLPVGGSGNSGQYTFFSPAAFPEVVSVGGTTSQDLRYGDYGDHAEVAAPTDFLTTNEDGGYETFRGTSASSPLAAGLGALLRATDPTLHVQELRQLLRLGADDQVGDPAEDTPGWDQFLGFGRLNAGRSMSLIDGPWIALDRPHYVCAGQLWIDLKDKTLGAGVDVTLTGSLGGDTETVTVAPVTAHGYYRGGLPLAWAGPDGPVVPGDGQLHVTHTETIEASVGPLSFTAVADCLKNVCLESLPPIPESGDCDDDGVADPGEIWTFAAPFGNFQTEQMLGTVAALTTASGSLELIDGTEDLGDLPPFEIADPVPFAVRVLPGSPVGEIIPLEFQLTGAGWDSDQTGCADVGHDQSFTIRGNSDGLAPDTWPAFPPSGLTGSSDACPAQFDLSWDAVTGASGYAVYRSELSCEDAEFLTTSYGVSAVPTFSDTDAENASEYFYAVEAIEPATGCVSLRACVSGGCLCAPPGDPTNLLAARNGDDVVLGWDDPGVPGLTWNVYRDTNPDPSVWGPPLQAGVTDADPVTPGIQFVDIDAVGAGSPLFYLIRSDNGCAESTGTQ